MAHNTELVFTEAHLTDVKAGSFRQWSRIGMTGIHFTVLKLEHVKFAGPVLHCHQHFCGGSYDTRLAQHAGIPRTLLD